MAYVSGDVELPPKELSITWGSDKRYWQWFWILLESRDYAVVEIPRLLDVCWLEISGTYDMSSLPCGAKYEVSFDVMMTDAASGWDASPVTLSLDLPGGTSRSRVTNLSNLPRNEWKLLPVGTFQAPAKGGGVVRFSMTETEMCNWKEGLIIKGAVIRRTYN